MRDSEVNALTRLRIFRITCLSLGFGFGIGIGLGLGIGGTISKTSGAASIVQGLDLSIIRSNADFVDVGAKAAEEHDYIHHNLSVLTSKVLGLEEKAIASKLGEQLEMIKDQLDQAEEDSNKLDLRVADAVSVAVSEAVQHGGLGSKVTALEKATSRLEGNIMDVVKGAMATSVRDNIQNTKMEMSAKISDLEAHIADLAAVIDEGRAVLKSEEAPVDRGGDEMRRVAVLISGQWHRFVWQDSFRFAGGLRKVLGCADGEACKVEVIDVFAVLSSRQTKAFQNPQPVTPPYSAGENFDNITENITKHFKDAGASQVSIRVIPDDLIAQMEQEIGQLVSGRGEDAEGWWERTRKLDKFGMRWTTNTAMLVLRHLAYHDALQSEAAVQYKYNEFLYVREDNVFVLPDLVRPLGKPFPNLMKPMVMVDSHCRFGGLSDKMYYLNRLGADIIFPKEGIAQHLLAWLDYGRKSSDGNDPLRTEKWLQHLMHSQKMLVRPGDFGRVDMRYFQRDEQTIDSCIPHLYFKCFNKKILGDDRIRPCVDPKEAAAEAAAEAAREAAQARAQAEAEAEAKAQKGTRRRKPR